MSRTDARNAILCAAAVTAAFFLVNPFVNMPFDDDWCYSFTVRQLLNTGHITYCGWSEPLIITYSWWAALFAKCFGYSFITLRFSTLPLAVGCAVFSYLLARKADLRPTAAIFVSLTLCLSPLFLPLALSFMTDIPSLCFTLISLYALINADQSAKTRSAILWLFAGVFFAIIGGMGRQTVWIVPLCVIPYLILVRRSDIAFVIAGGLGILLVIVDIVLCIRWLQRQPNALFGPPLLESIRAALNHPRITITNTTVTVFTTAMFALPAVLPFSFDSLTRFWQERKTWRSARAAIIILVLSAIIATRPEFGMAPWLYNIVTIRGVIGPLELAGRRPIVLPLAARGIVSALVLMTTYLFVARAAEFVVDWHSAIPRLRAFFSSSPAVTILTIFGVVYFSLIVIRGAESLIFDRYCLPLIPCLAIPLLRRRSLAFAWPFLIVYCLYALASTQDNLALAKARRSAIDRLESHDDPPT